MIRIMLDNWGDRREDGSDQFSRSMHNQPSAKKPSVALGKAFGEQYSTSTTNAKPKSTNSFMTPRLIMNRVLRTVGCQAGAHTPYEMWPHQALGVGSYLCNVAPQ